MPPAATLDRSIHILEQVAALPMPQMGGFGPARLHSAGSQLFFQEDPAHSVFLVERGLIKLTRAHADGRGDRIVGLRGRGWVLGAAAAIANEQHVATGTAVVSSEVRRVAAAEFLLLLQTNQLLASHILQMHAREVSVGLTRLGDEAIPAISRLRRLLLDLASSSGSREHPNECRVKIPLRQWEIAQLLGVAPPYLCQLLSELQTEGALRREGHGVMVICREPDQRHRGPADSSES
jgi:CRP-like cAMP-binding protein